MLAHKGLEIPLLEVQKLSYCHRSSQRLQEQLAPHSEERLIYLLELQMEVVYREGDYVETIGW